MPKNKIELFEKCSVCKKNIKKQYYDYKKFCSSACYNKHWRNKNPEKAKYLNSFEVNSKYRWENKLKKECLICGFDRTTDFCHIISKKDGGKFNKKNVIILCPNHHRLFDNDRLLPEEQKIINKIIQTYEKT